MRHWAALAERHRSPAPDGSRWPDRNLLYLLFQGYPIVRGLMIAFSDYRFLIPDHQPFNGLDNYVEMWRDSTFWAALGRSVQYTALYVVLLVSIGLLGAVLIGASSTGRQALIGKQAGPSTSG